MMSRQRKLFMLAVFLNLVSCATPQETHPASPFDRVSSAKELLLWNWDLAERGDAAAQYMLAMAFNYGITPHKDDSIALKWLRRAAEQGNADAQIQMGLEYNRGLSVPKDNVIAGMWFILAERRCDKLAGRFRQALEKKLTQDQIAQAHDLALNWKEQNTGVKIMEKMRGYTSKCERDN